MRSNMHMKFHESKSKIQGSTDIILQGCHCDSDTWPRDLVFLPNTPLDQDTSAYKVSWK